MNKELSFYEFSQLTREEQQDLVFNFAESMSFTLKNDVNFVLYKLFDFYVEVGYNLDDSKVVSLTGFLKSSTSI